MKKTKIIATLGPSSEKPATLKSLISAGTNAFRLNCSHASLEEMASDIQLIRKTANSLGRPVAIMLDLQGPRLRTGRLRNNEPVSLKTGHKILIT
ncbi:MAG: pyruvate kinase, partial [Elusimicrobia bacterium]|nr:pyruvate kinase [Elusimicrobiota bacterium]